MKKTITFVCLLSALIIICAEAQEQKDKWKVDLTVVGDTGLPLKDAQVAVSYLLPTPIGQTPNNGEVAGSTDANGKFFASHDDTGSISITLRIEKAGYYPVRVTYELAGKYTPEKWDLHPTWTLKKIVNPIPMYAKSVNLMVPAFDKPIGFDFAKGDWIAPFGRGTNADILFTGHLGKYPSGYFDYMLTVSFPNPGDGIQEFKVPPTRFPGDGSALRSSQEAPADGYLPQWVLSKVSQRDENRNYYFRVDTLSGDNGNIKNTLYGKIYGDFMQFRYYLNPTPNDRNVEFDPKQDLLKEVRSFEQAKEP